MKPILCVVDDEREILSTYKDFFEDQYRVFSFDSPIKFIEALDSQEVLPDAVITDFKMPNISGIQMIKMVRERQLDFPILLLSGHIEKDVALDAIELGTFSILEKPIAFEKLQVVVERMIYGVELNRLRGEIRHIMFQIKEIYEGVREAILPHVPEEVLNRFFIEAEEGMIKRKLGLEDVLVQLDTKLDLLLKAEKSLLDLRKYLLYTPEGRPLYGNQKERLVQKGVSKMHLRKESAQGVKRYRAQLFLNDKISEFKAKKNKDKAG